MTDAALDLAVDDAELERLLRPYLRRELDAAGAEWRAVAGRHAAKWAAASRRRRWLGWLPKFRRGQGAVAQSYQRQWGGVTAADLVSAAEADTPILWRDRVYLGDARGIKRVHLLWLMAAIERLRPASVLEVGCGNGANLLVLAARFPEVRFAGLELTAEGVASIERVRAEGRLPAVLAEYSPLPPRDPEAIARLEARQGSAAELPFADGAFDLVFTDLALEQMEAIRAAALSEIARVAAKWTMMVEPFRDWNGEGARRDRIVAHDYFAARVDDLRGYGLRPVFVGGDLPTKIALGVGIAVCAKG